MAAKKAKKSGKTLGKKTMKKTKGGILIGLNQPTLSTGFLKIQPGTTADPGSLNVFKF